MGSQINENHIFRTMFQNKSERSFLAALLQTGRRCFLAQSGTSIVEVMFAVVIFMIIMIGGLQYFTLPQATIAKQKFRRMAVSAARQRVETLLALGFTGVTPDSNETSVAVTLENKPATRNTTVVLVDDSGDGLGGSDADSDTVDYKRITVDILWNDGRNQSVTLTTNVSAYGN